MNGANTASDSLSSGMTAFCEEELAERHAPGAVRPDDRKKKGRDQKAKLRAHREGRHGGSRARSGNFASVGSFPEI